MNQRNAKSKSILFVDEEQFVQQAIKRSFRKLQKAWELRFVNTPLDAAKALAEASVDVLVTETVFSGQSGLDLLKVVREKLPEIVRIILSGYSDRDVILKSVDLAHQYLAKPCEDEALQHTIQRAFIMKGLLEQDALKEIVSKIDSLPSLPSLYTELVQLLESEDASIQKVGDIIAKDISLTAKILKLVNSSFFALPQRVVAPAKAVSLLGLDLVKSIVLASGTFDKFKTLKFPNFTIDQLWDHAAQTAAYAKCIAKTAEHDCKLGETAFMAGLLHDIGKLLVAAHMPDRFIQILDKMRTQGITMFEAETQVLGSSHAAIGAYLLGLWGLPDPIIETAAFHHSPNDYNTDLPGIPFIVHVADAFTYVDNQILLSDQVIQGLDLAYIEEKGWLDQLSAWRQACGSMPAD